MCRCTSRCVCRCACRCVCAGVCAGVHAEARGPLQVSSTLFFETSSLTKPGLATSARQAVRQISGDMPASASLALGLKAHMAMLSFYRSVGDLNSSPHDTTARLFRIAPNPQQRAILVTNSCYASYRHHCPSSRVF